MNYHYKIIYHSTCKSNYLVWFLVFVVLWYIKLFGLFNAKSILLEGQ